MGLAAQVNKAYINMHQVFDKIKKRYETRKNAPPRNAIFHPIFEAFLEAFVLYLGSLPKASGPKASGQPLQNAPCRALQ